MAEHSITPPPELVQNWVDTLLPQSSLKAFTAAAQWGADTELEACCEWFQEFYKSETWVDLDLRTFRAARRPKPPSLKETLLARVARIPGEGADAAYLRHWVDNESQRLVDLLHEVFKSLPS